MSFLRNLAIVLGIGALLVAGCSEKKEQAEQLEQEVRDQESMLDTTGDTMMTSDTGQATADAAAIPEEEPEPEIDEQPMPPRPTGSGYTVQVASCPDREYADYLIELYQNRGYEPYMVQATVEGQQYYRVRIGSFDEFQQAQALKKELMYKYSEDTWVDYVGS